MGINMDIRNEPEFNFLELGDLDDATRNEILEILKPDEGLDNSKLPWDIGEKQYEMDSDIGHPRMEDVPIQWQHYENRNFIEDMGESMTMYDSCVTTPPMMATALPPGHPYGGTQMIEVYSDSRFGGMGHAFGNSPGGDPNAYPLVGEYTYSHPQAIYATTTEMMNEPPIRDNERRGRGRGGGNGTNGKRESYNRAMNSNNDMQTSYAVQSPNQYGQIMSGAVYSFPPQGHIPAGTQFFFQQRTNPTYSQGPHMGHAAYGHNSHPAAYGHHASNFPNHPHSPSNANYRGSQTTYYNQETVKNPIPKHHDKRGYHQENCHATSYRHTSNNDVASPKRNYVKSNYVVNNNPNFDARNNVVRNNSTAKHANNNKVALSSDESKFEITDEIVVKQEVPETVVDTKTPVVTAIVDKNTTVASGDADDGLGRENEVVVKTEPKISPTKARIEIQSPPRPSKSVEVPVEPKEPTIAVKNEKPLDDAISATILETPGVAPPATVSPAVSVAPAPIPVGKSWASIVITGAPTLDTVRSPPPTTKPPAARLTPIHHPPASPAETVATPKTPIQEPNVQPRNETVTTTPVRNNAEPPPKSAESSPWAETKMPAESPQRNNLNDPAVFRMGELLLKYQMDKQTVSLLPRGLTNRSNYCYINSILQALLACPPFYNLLMALPYPRNSGKNSSTPLIDNMARFVHEFSPLAEGARLPRKDRSQKRGEETAVDVQFGVAFEPSYVYTMLKNTSCAGVFSVEGRQEDAEEFLSCLLNGISDEMLELMKLVNAESNEVAPDVVEPNANHNNDEEGWKVMGPKNKGSITRCTEFGRTPLSDIFRGQLRSRVIRVQEESTDNVQPFFTLQLDIEKAESVEGALESLFGKDRVEGMTCSKTKQQIEAWKQVSLEELPVILILHLKWFDYKLDGCSKIVKRVGFPIDLKLDSKKLLSPNLTKKLMRKQSQYKLFAVTYHDGKEASKGHYVTDAFHVGYGAWVRYDDSSVKGIYEMDVLNPSPPRVPYLLYYRRCDTIGNNPPNTPRTR